ncbi:hypothetical protein INT45_013047 [Circinella minor]|uniref:Uncharacterized protein n=1 Tax=Circinella minor TaxID=1195481 RepID=A0A8H7S3Q7_9FUNG|nr:hypothetical protein INT45_013047 [Circinella minor]
MPTTNNSKNNKSSSQLSSSSTQPLPSLPSQPQRHDKKNLHDFLTSLLISPNPPSAQDTVDFENLVLLMKNHTLFDPTHIPQIQDIKRFAAELPCLIPASTKPNVTNTISSNRNMNKITSKSSNKSDDSNNNNNDKSSSKETTSYATTLKPNIAPVPNFEFSFSSDRQVNFPPPPEKPLYTTDRPTYRRGGVYADEYDEVEDVKLEDEVDPEELEAIIQQRKILPLPKSRWGQKTVTATVLDEEDKSNKEQNVTNRNNQEIVSSSSKPGTSILGQQQERIAIRSSGGPSNRSSSSKTTTTTIKTSSLPLSPLSEEAQEFTSAENIQSLKPNKNLDESNNNLEKEMDVKSIVMSDKQQQQQQKFTSFRSETATQNKRSKNKIKKKKSSSVTKPTDHPINDDHEHSKRNTKLSATKKGKKSQHPLEQQQQSFSSRKDWLDVDLNSSDVSMIKNGNSDEWICLFCQYEIFRSGLEATLRKRGGYRRRRQRLLRAKDMNDSILQHHNKYASQLNVEEEEEKDSLLPLVRMSVDTRIRIVAGIHKDLVFNDCNNNNGDDENS